MRVFFLVIIIILTSCKSVELKQPVSYFWPIKLHLGTGISIISSQLGFDTTKYLKVGFAQHLKEFKLERSALDKLNFKNNYADSLKVYFYRDRLFSIDIYASENRRVEYLKFDIKGMKEKGFGLGGSFKDGNYGNIDTTLNYGKYRELSYRSSERNMSYEYYEDIVNNIARLTILNEKMLKSMPRRRIH